MAESKPFEVISVDKLEVTCDGGSVALGHPRVFLHIDKDKGQVMCPYCSRVYVYKSRMSHVASHG
jgi:uncharacterized Zn-finger protein